MSAEITRSECQLRKGRRGFMCSVKGWPLTCFGHVLLSVKTDLVQFQCFCRGQAWMPFPQVDFEHDMMEENKQCIQEQVPCENKKVIFAKRFPTLCERQVSCDYTAITAILEVLIKKKRFVLGWSHHKMLLWPQSC